ncbi:hypothetical protein [Croceicoccus bisphenolivorans]|uniref:hypothetical protein n=1 Tax=Croceicoccus bisphenolivorans TaxID=1783232 RepID=UPI0008313AD5|nr:hypothetical protein [Croceicoccus bisphenolivorans]
MATLAGSGLPRSVDEQAERKFFMVMAIVITVVIAAGFSTQLAMGRSTFAVPLPYHLHAFVFFGWVALYLAQNVLIAGGNVRLHRTLGWLAVVWTPVMVALGFTIMIVALRRAGGPFFFAQNEFLVANSLLLVLFAALVFCALKVRRYSGWHRRLMLVAMALLSDPGIGRLLPMPLLIPHAWRIGLLVAMVFPLAGMIRDKLRRGAVHPAYWWGLGAVLVTQIVADIIAYSAFGISLTEQLVAGTPGAERPMEAFLPPGFAM